MTSLAAEMRTLTSDIPNFVPSEHKARLYGHDIIHTIMNNFTRMDNPKLLLEEQRTAIFQAVLTHDPKVSRKRTWEDGAQSTNDKDIKRLTLPGIKKFIAEVMHDQGRVPATLEGLSDQQVQATLNAAIKLEALFHETYGRKFSSIPLEELKQMAVEPMRVLYQQAIDQSLNESRKR